MQFIPPYDQVGVTPPGPWTNAAPQAGIPGSIVNADVFPAVQNELLAIIAADPSLTASTTDLGQAQKSIAYQIAQALSTVPEPGATGKGGLAKDSSNNFLLALLTNLTPDNRPAPVAADVLALGRAADGLMVSVSAGALAAYILSNIVATNTFQQLVANPVLYVGGPGASDANSGTTTASPKATIAGAQAAAAAFNFATTSLTIEIQAAGSYALPASIPNLGGPIIILGSVAGVVVTTTGTICNSQLTINNVELENTGSSTATILSQSGGNVTIENTALVLAGGGSSSHIQTGPGGSLTLNGGVTFSGGGLYALWANGGTIFLGSANFAVQGNPTFGTFAFVNSLGQIFVISGASFSGSANGQRYSVDANSVIQSAGGGQNFFPGSIAGATATGGEYV